jgi:hypothetical protein
MNDKQCFYSIKILKNKKLRFAFFLFREKQAASNIYHEKESLQSNIRQLVYEKILI